MEKFDTLIKLLGKPKSPKDFEVYHLIRDLKIQMSKLQDNNKRTSNDPTAYRNFTHRNNG